MNTSNILWDDEARNRTIELQVQWKGESDIKIEALNPTRVILRNDDGSSRSIGVHTEAGRRHLASKVDIVAVTNQLSGATTSSIPVSNIGSIVEGINATQM